MTATVGDPTREPAPPAAEVAVPPPTDGPSPERWVPRGFGWVVVGTAAVSALQQVRVVLDFARHLTNEDQTLLWYAAHEWSAGRAHQPTFYGQRYGTNLEGIPVAIVHAVGVPFQTALPLVLAALALVGWLALAWAAWRRHAPVAALVAAAAPFLLTVDHATLVATYPPAVGRTVAMIAVALAVAWPERRGVLVAFVALGGLAVCWDSGAALLVGPVLAWLVLQHWRRRDLAWAALGLAVPAAWLALVAVFFARHPDYDLHAPPGFSLDWPILERSIRNPQEMWGLFGSELWRSAWVPILAFVTAVVLLLWTRRRVLVAPAAVALGFAIAAMSTPKALDGLTSVYFRVGRIVLLAPAVVWFLWFLAGRSRPLLGRSRVRTVAASAVIALVAVSAVFTTLDLTHRLDSLRTTAEQTTKFPVVTVASLYDQCNRIDDVGRRYGVALAVFFTSDVDRNDAYGCAALHHRVETLFPSYERRTWRLEDEAARTRTGLILWRVDAQYCQRVPQAAGLTSCRVEQDPTRHRDQPGVAILRFPPRSALAVLRALAIPIRPFGPGCHPREPSTCTTQG